MLASLLLFAGCFETNAVFSVSPTRQVRFAKGNLEYDSINGYSFAANQYDYGGSFVWGTGSDPTGTPAYYNEEEGSINLDYRRYQFDDWGKYIDGGWRTLSIDEWDYLIWGRANADSKRGTATVCGVPGLVLLPDSCLGENGFHAGFDEGWNTNVYDTSSWLVMEATGAVFLPVNNSYEGYHSGCYWSSSSALDRVECVSFDDNGVDDQPDLLRGIARHPLHHLPVRLVQDI